MTPQANTSPTATLPVALSVKSIERLLILVRHRQAEFIGVKVMAEERLAQERSGRVHLPGQQRRAMVKTVTIFPEQIAPYNEAHAALCAALAIARGHTPKGEAPSPPTDDENERDFWEEDR